MSSDEHEPTGARARLIDTVRTPLGFFALVILVAEALLGVAATVLREDVDPAYSLAAMVALILLLVLIVAGFALFRPEALHGRRMEPARPARADRGSTAADVRGPHVLCASTDGVSAQELDRYVEVVARRFPDVTVRRELSLDALRSTLREAAYHVVHLVTPVAADGLLRAGGEVGAAADLRDWLDTGSARLVVLTACDSLPLARELARVTSVVAVPIAAVRSDVVQWSERFYDQLARGVSISGAYAAAGGARGVRAVLLLAADVAFVP